MPSSSAVGASAVDSVGRSYAEELARQQSSKSEMDKEAFLKILVAQLKYQDPTKPVSDTEFISQMAQFSALEQMSSLNQNFVDTQAYGLLGRYVLAEIKVDGEDKSIFGVVDSVVKLDGKTYLNVGEDRIEVGDVAGVFDQAMFGTNDDLLNNAALIGKQVSAYYTNAAGEESVVSGILERIFIEEGILRAVVGGQSVNISDIFDIAAYVPPEESPAEIPAAEGAEEIDTSGDAADSGDAPLEGDSEE